MTIADRISDADFLRESGRPIAALSMLMIALAASSRRRLPRSMRSIKDPSKEMGDAEAFQLFVGGRIWDIVFSGRNRGSIRTSGISLPWNGQQQDLAWLLYKQFRNALLHEGGLPVEVQLREDQADSSSDVGHQLRMYFDGPSLCIHEGVLSILRTAVVEAHCNGPEFGIKHLVLTPRSGGEFEANRDALAEELHVSPGRIENFCDVLLANPTFDFAGASTEALSAIVTGSLSFGPIAMLTQSELIGREEDRQLTAAGVNAIQRVAQYFQVLDAAAQH